MPDEANRLIRPITTKLTEAERKSLETSDALLFDPVEYDEAIVGVFQRETKVVVAAYDYERLTEITLALNGGSMNQDEDWDDAVQWVDYNMVRGALYAGKTGPLVICELAEETPDEIEEGVQIIELAGKKWTLA